MKKILGVVLAVLLVAGVFMAGFSEKAHNGKASAGEKYDRVVGQVVSRDVTAQTVVVKEEASGASRTI